MLFLLIGITFGLLLGSVLLGIPSWYALLAALILFGIYTHRQGFSFKEILGMCRAGIKKSMLVLTIFFFIGALTAIWLSAGTIPYLVYLGIQIINPQLFILSAFVLTALMSFILGSSFGTASTIGLVLITIAKSSGVNVYITAGAIISGLYYGDRGSPMSSSLNLLSSVTGTEVYKNVKMTFQTAFVPLIFTCGVYLFWSFQNPMQTTTMTFGEDIAAAFHITPILLLPALAILVMCVLKVNVRRAMFISIVIGCFISFFVQGNSVTDILRTIIWGVHLPAELAVSTLIKGGGLLSMVNSALVVLVSCCIAGVFEKANLLQNTMEKFHPKTRVGLFFTSMVVAITTSAIGCNQTISVIMTSEIMGKLYRERNLPNEDLAKDVSLSATLLAALIPWNISVLTPMTLLGLSGIGYMPYLIFLYAMPIYHIILYYFKDKAALRGATQV